MRSSTSSCPTASTTATAANDAGGLTGDRLATGLDPTDKGFYHGGDVAGLLDRLDYIESLGTTAIWMAPIFKNRPVQGTGADASAGYHGYWITDFTQIDPHFGTNAELEAFVDAAHARGIKVFFDIITNHTADVIDYAEGDVRLPEQGQLPVCRRRRERVRRSRLRGHDTFPPMNLDGFPYDPVFRTAADETVKAPAWLNDRTMYHNRGDSTFVGENSEYGDFFGLDDLFTERPRGRRRDGRHLRDVGDRRRHRRLPDRHRQARQHRVLAAVRPGPPGARRGAGNDDFFMFGEVFDANPAFMSRYTTEGKLQATLDFGFQSRATNFAAVLRPDRRAARPVRRRTTGTPTPIRTPTACRPSSATTTSAGSAGSSRGPTPARTTPSCSRATSWPTR